jgi:hypothetical protein
MSAQRRNSRCPSRARSRSECGVLRDSATVACAIALAAISVLACAGSSAPRDSEAFALELAGASRDQNELVDSIRAKLAPLISRGTADGSALTLDYDELYAPLTARERAFVDALRALEPEIPPRTKLGSVE